MCVVVEVSELSFKALNILQCGLEFAIRDLLGSEKSAKFISQGTVVLFKAPMTTC